MAKVKICGITSAEDAVSACEAGADLIGFVFVEGTPRNVSVDAVREIVKKVRSSGKKPGGFVGLFKDADRSAVETAVKACGLDHVQLHGDETPEYCVCLKKAVENLKIIKVFKVKKGIIPCGVFGPEDYAEADYYLFDTYEPTAAGGTGKPFDWASVNRYSGQIDRPYFVAGGLNPANVRDAVRALHPYGVDVSSGVESAPGKKNAELLKEFVKNAKKP
jgi:phosphoribosylanthranilate isomerase